MALLKIGFTSNDRRIFWYYGQAAWSMIYVGKR